MPDPVKSPRAAALKAQLEAERDRLAAELAPYRATYERLVNAPELLEARAKIKELSARLAPVLNELAALVRAGGSAGVRAEPGVYDGREG